MKTELCRELLSKAEVTLRKDHDSKSSIPPISSYAEQCPP